MKKIALFFGLVLVVVIAISAHNYDLHITGSNQPNLTAAPWQPAHLQIPRLQIDADVMDVGATPSGAMNTPTSQAQNSPYWKKVFWYDLGAAPGQAGNAVLAGHVNSVNGDPAVFWSLGSLQVGDPLTVRSVDGTTHHFVVRQVVRYPALAPPQQALKNVFGPTQAHQLNLITCSGTWTKDGFDERLVVFTTEVGS